MVLHYSDTRSGAENPRHSHTDKQMKIHFKHKCRSCGAITDIYTESIHGEHGMNTAVNNASILLLNSHALNSISKKSLAPPLVSLHRCSQNTIGLSDLIGAEIKE